MISLTDNLFPFYKIWVCEAEKSSKRLSSQQITCSPERRFVSFTLSIIVCRANIARDKQTLIVELHRNIILYYIRILLYVLFLLYIEELMSIKRYRKSQAIWCNGCDAVFDTLIIAEEHARKTGHGINVVEFITDNDVNC